MLSASFASGSESFEAASHTTLLAAPNPGQAPEALQCAEKADPLVDLEWMRIRHEMDLDYW
jgi:hypothetical protein